MQVVIETDDKLYNRIKYLEPKSNTMLDVLIRSVQNGTPLPKGHGDLIDRSNLLCISEYDGENEKIYVPYYEIENALTIIEADEED